MAKISVVVPCYNSAAYLEPCVKSLTAQSLREIEILLVDDGSTDQTRAVAERLAAADNRITVLTHAHAGPGEARNLGLTVARAPYVMFVDSDDAVPPEACEALLRVARAGAADIVVGRMQGRKANALTQSRGDAIAALFTGRLSMSSCAKLYRRSFLDEHRIRFPAQVYIEDRHFVLQCLLGGARLARLDAVVYERRVRSESTMHHVGAKHIADATAVYRLDTALLERSGFLEYCGRHVAWATLVVDAHLARAIGNGNGALRDALARELKVQERYFRTLPGSRVRAALLGAAAARMRRAVLRGSRLRFVGARLALLKLLVL